MKEFFLFAALTFGAVGCSDTTCPAMSCNGVPLSIQTDFRSRPAAGTYTFKAIGQRVYECTVEITDANATTWSQCANLYGSIQIVTEPERATAIMRVPDYAETIDFSISADELVTSQTLTPTYHVTPENECSPECVMVAQASLAVQ